MPCRNENIVNNNNRPFTYSNRSKGFFNEKIQCIKSFEQLLMIVKNFEKGCMKDSFYSLRILKF